MHEPSSAKTSAAVIGLAKAPEPDFTITIGGEKLNLKDYPPITQGDKKLLKKEPYNLKVPEMAKWGEEEESLFVLFLLKRVRENTTLGEVDSLPAKTIQDIAGYCLRKSGDVPNPFRSPSSTSSPTSTAGPGES